MKLEVIIQASNNPNTFVFQINKFLIETKFKLYHKSGKNIEESNLACYLFETFSEISEIFIKSNFIAISFNEKFELSNIYLESIKNIIHNFLNDGHSIINDSYLEEYVKIKNCIEDHINPALEMEGGLFVCYQYSPKNKHLTIQTIGSCRNNPSIFIDLEQTKRIINRCCNLDIERITPIILNT
jgi:hypothetical protein